MKAKASPKSAKRKDFAIASRSGSWVQPGSAASASPRSASVSFATPLPPFSAPLYVAPSMGQRQTLAPDAAEIERLAEAAIARLPDHFRVHLRGVVLRVEEFADDEVLEELGIEDPFDLSGLYSGRSLDKQS